VPAAGAFYSEHIMNLIFVQTSLDQSDEELIAEIRAVMEYSRRHPAGAMMIIQGFEDDPRELWEIPEVQAHLRRLVDFGFIAILARSTGVRELGVPDYLADCPGFGAFEVWAHGRGLLRTGSNEIPEALVEMFEGTIFPAAEESLQRNLHRYAHVPANPELMLEFGRENS
jgi:hypothetical protein